jgi:superfamily II DNA or RNA helicase
MILNEHPDSNRRQPARNYQASAVKAAWRELKHKKAVQVVLPSGSGKTRVIAELADKFYRETGKRTLIIAPMRELVLHAEREVTKYTRLSVSVEMAEQRARDTTVVCATKHTMSSRLKSYKRNAFGLVVFDESDLAAADTYDAIKKYFHKAKVYGTTATPDRYDGRKGIAPVVFERELKEQIEVGILSRIRRIGVKIAEVSRAKILAGDFDPKWLDEIFSREKHLHEVVKAMLEKADKRPTLVFGVTVLHAKLLANLFNRYRPGCARWISGKSENQPETLEAFRRGDFQFLCNCMLVSRGVDVPPVACIGMAAPTLSRTKYLQMLGRGTRRSPGKKNLLVVDFTFNSDVHALDAVDAVAGEGKEEVGVRARERKRPEFDIVDVINEVEGELESSPKLRKRIQAKVAFEWRRIKGIDWASIPEKTWRTKTNRQLAEDFGCSAQTVSKFRPSHISCINEVDLRINWKKQPWSTHSNGTIARLLGVAYRTVAIRRPKNVTFSRKDTIRSKIKSITDDMWRTMQNRQIATMLDCSNVVVWKARPSNIPAPRTVSALHSALSTIDEKTWRSMSNKQLAQKMQCSHNHVGKYRPSHAPPPPALHIQRKIKRVHREQRELLERASRRMSRPPHDSKIGQALSRFTNKSQNSYYDATFDRKIRRSAPSWWRRAAR